MPKNDPTAVNVVLGAGAIIRSNHSIMVKAYAEQDGTALKAQRDFFAALKKVVLEYQQADNKLFDSQIASGYVDSDWANGIERLVKKDEDKPRGRKATAKPDPAASC
jgi:hypothetical protein